MTRTRRGVGALEFARGHAEWMRRVRACLSLERVGAQEVREGAQGSYELTGHPQPSIITLPPQADLVGSVLKALESDSPEERLATLELLATVAAGQG